MKTTKLFTILICISILLVSVNESYKILGVFPTNFKSHYIAGGALMKGLAEKGHDVTVISQFPQTKPLKNFRDITVLGLDTLINEKYPQLFHMEDMGLVEKLNLILTVGETMTNFTLTHEVFQKFLHTTKEQYDVIIIQIFKNEAFLGLGHHFNAPIIGFSTFGAMKWSNDMVGNPTPMSYVPNHFFVKFSSKMNFVQRIINVVMYMSESIFTDWYSIPQQERIYNEIFPDPKPRLVKLQKNVSLVLLNNHFSLCFPRPYVPNMIEVGGLHINRTPQKLPNDLQQILDEAEHGVIYFSLGSNITPKNIPIEKQIEILNVFRKLKQKVLWKWDNAIPTKPDNVYIDRWYPQDDLLAHPNMKLFITHGGLLSITETIYHAVPVIGIPFFADQHLNMAQAESSGYALTLLLKDLDEDTFFQAITEMLTNDKYAKTIKLMSDRYRDQPLTPLETAIYWTEYVARHKGTPHMRSAGLDLSFFAYHSLDVFATLLGGLYLIWRLTKWVCGRMFSRKHKTIQSKDEKKKKAE